MIIAFIIAFIVVGAVVAALEVAYQLFQYAWTLGSWLSAMILGGIRLANTYAHRR